MRSDTTPAAARDLAGIWEDTCGRIDALLGEQPDSAIDAPVTTVPGTRVRDVLIHLIDTVTTASNDPHRVMDAALTLPVATDAP